MFNVRATRAHFNESQLLIRIDQEPSAVQSQGGQGQSFRHAQAVDHRRPQIRQSQPQLMTAARGSSEW